MSKPCFAGSVAGDKYRTICPKIPFSYTLNKKAEINPFVITSQSQSILIARCRISYYFKVPMIVYRIGPKINNSVSIEVFIFDIARPKEEPATFKNRLSRDAFFHDIFTIIQYKFPIGILHKIVVCK